MKERAPELAEGETVAGRYRVERVLGEGGFGTVYAAVDTTLGRAVALKVLSRVGEGSASATARFRREAQASAALPPEHVATVFDTGEHEGQPFIVMERLEGDDLTSLIVSVAPVSVTRAVDLVLAALLGLAHAHARGMVHRDLKPSNLFLARRADGGETLKVLDFGIAKLQAAPEALTVSGTLLGTPRYMAPEQIREVLAVDARADVWAMGVVLYELLTKRPIFDAKIGASFVARILLDPPVPLRERRPDIPVALDAVVSRCLEKEPSARFDDVAALARALAPFASTASRDLPDRIARVLAGKDQRASSGEALAPTVVAPLAGHDDETASLHESRERTASLETKGVGPPAPRARPERRGLVRLYLGVTAGTLAILALTALAYHRLTTSGVETASPSSSSTPAASSAPARASSAREPAPPASVTPTAAAPSSAAPPPAPGASPSSNAAHRAPHAASVASPTIAPPDASPEAPTPPPTEADRIRDACFDVDGDELHFLVPDVNGPRYAMCAEIGHLGCDGVRARCAQRAVDATKRDACTRLATALRQRAACP